MKTVFKVGMKVYDQINFPDMEGKVVKIHEDESKYPLGVCFNKKMSIHYYDLEGCFRKENIPTLSTKPYKIEFQGFEQKAPAPIFEDAIKWLLENNKYDVSISDDSKATYFTKDENYSAFEALRKLTIIRDYYNEGWKPDWKNDYENKSVILTENDKIKCEENYSYKRVLSFKSKEIRNKFLEEQIDLLEIAKPLL
jgi:hypothetical protein|nr:MAG TPA: hypothetical protein [Caudoviricetes sp.]